MNGNKTIRVVVPALFALMLNSASAATHAGNPGAHDDTHGKSAATDSAGYNGPGEKAKAHNRGLTLAAANAGENGKGMSDRSSSKQQGRHDMRASQLLGKDVRNQQGDEIGEIKDLFVNLKTGQVPYAVLSLDGGLGDAGKLHPFPLTSFDLSRDRGELVLNIDKGKLKNMPGFDSNTWPDYSDKDGLFAQVDRFFGNETGKNPATRGMVRASELLGRDVNDRKGEDVGEIQDAVLDIGRGRISYVVLDFDKRWSLDNKLLPMPLKAFALPKERGAPFVFNLDRDRLDMARGFERSKWPDLNSPAQRATTEDYFLALERPTQKEAAAGVTTSGSSGGDTAISGGIYADPVTGASVPGERENTRPKETGAK